MTYKYQYKELPHNHGTPEPRTITRDQLLARLTVWRGYPDTLPRELLHQLEHLKEHGTWYRLAPFESYRVDIEEGTEPPAPYEPFFDDPHYAHPNDRNENPSPDDRYGDPFGDVDDRSVWFPPPNSNNEP